MKTLRFHVLALTAAFLALSGVAHAGSLTLAWDASPDPAVFGYRLYWGTAPGQYTSSLDVRSATTMTVNNLVDGRAYYFVVRAYNASPQLARASTAPSRSRAASAFPAAAQLATSTATAGATSTSIDPRLVAGLPRSGTTRRRWLRLGGASGDLPVAGDYDGDGEIDIAVFRPSTGQWFVADRVVNSRALSDYLWGIPGRICPVQGDYDGDGKNDVAVFRPDRMVHRVGLETSSRRSRLRWGAAGR